MIIKSKAKNIEQLIARSNSGKFSSASISTRVLIVLTEESQNIISLNEFFVIIFLLIIMINDIKSNKFSSNATSVKFFPFLLFL
jgi:hypothetical protein